MSTSRTKRQAITLGSTVGVMLLDTARNDSNSGIVHLVRNTASTRQSSQRVISTWCPTLPAHSISDHAIGATKQPLLWCGGLDLVEYI
jgi:hypothetical protein